MKDSRPLGQVAYEALGSVSAWRDGHNYQMLLWEQLDQGERAKWEAVATAVLRARDAR